MKRLSFLALFALGLYGCATADLPANFVLDPAQREGLAIISMTLSGKPLDKVSSFEYRIRHVRPTAGDAVTETRYFDSARQHARWVESADAGDHGERRVIVKAPESAEPLDIAERGAATGRVALLYLPAGTYEFYDWTLREPNVYGGIEYSPKQAFSYRFAVSPGQATYLGRIDLDLGERGVQKLRVDDRNERDVALARGKVPAIRAYPVVSEVKGIGP